MSGRAWARRGVSAIVMLVLLVVSGCIVIGIPTPEHGLVGGTGVLSESETRVLELGSTSRTDVILQWGQPATTRCEERVLVYHWAVAHGWILFVVGGGYTAYMFPIAIPKSYLVLFLFDETGRLARVERGEDLFAYTPPLGPWLPEECAEPPAPERSETLADVVGLVPDSVIDVIEDVPNTDRPTQAVRRLRVRIDPFADARGREIDPSRLAHGSLETGAVGLWTYRRTADLVRATVADHWLAAGHRITADRPDLVVEGSVEGLDLDVDWSWVAPPTRRAEIEVVLRVGRRGRDALGLERRYRASGGAPVGLWPEAATEWESALTGALRSLREQIAADEDLERYIRQSVARPGGTSFSIRSPTRLSQPIIGGRRSEMARSGTRTHRP